MDEETWNQQLADRRARLEVLRRDGRAHIVARVTLLPPSQGGRHTPVYSDLRPQLWLGQTLIGGQKLFWDAVWLLDGEEPMQLGETRDVTLFLVGLPPIALSLHEYVEFYEGSRRIATGEIIHIHAPGHPQHQQPSGGLQ
jgi:translation elongation factor EF-Tu-like GTPase